MLVGLVGTERQCMNAVNGLSASPSLRTRIQLRVNSFMMRTHSTVTTQERAARFSDALKSLPKVGGKLLMVGPLSSPAEVKVLRDMGATIWHLGMSETVPIVKGDLLVGADIKSSNGYGLIEAVSETRLNYQINKAQIPHPRDKQAGASQ